MSGDSLPTDDAARLRRQAEAELRAREADAAQSAADDDHARALHELQVHQIELELQNEELQRARAELEEALARATELYEFAPTGYLTLDPGGVILQTNLTATRLLGLERSQLVGRSLGRLVEPGDRHVLSAFLTDALTTGAGSRCQVTLLREGHAPMVVQIEGTRSVDGRECRAIVLDITARERAQAQVQILSRAVAQSPVSIVITDTEGQIEYVNPAFTKVTAYEAAEVLGKNVRTFRSGLHPPAFYAELWATITAGEDWHGVLQSRRKDGTPFWESASISPVADSAGRITQYVAVKEDITERRLLEEQFRQAQKMEAVGHLAGGIAHDFNNELTVISGYSQLLERALPGASGHHPWIGEIQCAAARSAALARQLLAFGRRQVLQPEVLDLGKVVTATQPLLGKLIREDIIVRTDLAPDLALVSADEGQIQQVLMNLCTNARDAMPDGGTITIATRTVVIGNAHAGVGVGARVGPHARLSVTDTGHGMADDVRSRIFEPFFTTKAQGKGTGLGLAMVYGFVTQSEGHIEVESAPGEGTTIHIFLPAIGGESEQPVALPSPAGGCGGDETILVVDDEVGVGAVVRYTLEDAGYTVLLATGADAVREFCDAAGGTIHLLLTDVVMPGTNGREVAALVQARRPGTPVLYMSGYDAGLLAGDPGGGAPRMAFIAKPFLPAELLAKVRSVLDAARDAAPRGRRAAPPPPDVGS